MLFYNDEFFDDLGEIIDSLDINENMEDYENGLTCYECQLETIEKISADWIIQRMDEDRFPEDSDKTDEKIMKALSLIDFNAVNEAMPKLWYPTKTKVHFTKEDIIKLL